MTVQTAVYFLCFATCATCAGLLVRAWLRTRARLLLWSAVSFILLAVNNGLVVFDLVLLPDVDLRIFRHLAALAAVCTLIFGFVWDTDR
jgi:hypothetical protein